MPRSGTQAHGAVGAGRQPLRAENRNGKTVIPNGRFVTPLGKSIEVAPHPYGLILNHEAGVAVTANSGIEPLSISIIRNIYSDQPEVQQIPPGSTTDEGVLASVFMGLAISPDGKTVYVAGGQENKIYLFDLTVGNWISLLRGTPTRERASSLEPLTSVAVTSPTHCSRSRATSHGLMFRRC